MKKILLSILLISIFAVSAIIIGQFYIDPNTNSSQDESAQVKVIRAFWNDALSGRDVEKYISQTPVEYFNEKPRCLPDSEDISDRKNKIPSTFIVLKNNFGEDIKKTALKINEEQNEILDIRNYRSWKNEAIVEATYRGDKELDYKKKQYFFMIKTSEGWKTFLDDSVLALSNSEYAKYECK